LEHIYKQKLQVGYLTKQKLRDHEEFSPHIGIWCFRMMTQADYGERMMIGHE